MAAGVLLPSETAWRPVESLAPAGTRRVSEHRVWVLPDTGPPALPGGPWGLLGTEPSLESLFLSYLAISPGEGQDQEGAESEGPGLWEGNPFPPGPLAADTPSHSDCPQPALGPRGAV